MITLNGVGITTVLNGQAVKKTLSSANETVTKGIYNATTLSAVDADLAVGNIKAGVTIFGFLGTAPSTPTHDVQGITFTSNAGGAGLPVFQQSVTNLAAGTDLVVDTQVINLTATGTIEAGMSIGCGYAGLADKMKVRLYIDAVQVAETGFITNNSQSTNLYSITGFANSVASGNRNIVVAVHNYDGAAWDVYISLHTVFAGAVKVS